MRIEKRKRQFVSYNNVAVSHSVIGSCLDGSDLIDKHHSQSLILPALLGSASILTWVYLQVLLGK